MCEILSVGKSFQGWRAFSCWLLSFGSLAAPAALSLAPPGAQVRQECSPLTAFPTVVFDVLRMLLGKLKHAPLSSASVGACFRGTCKIRRNRLLPGCPLGRARKLHVTLK